MTRPPGLAGWLRRAGLPITLPRHGSATIPVTRDACALAHPEADLGSIDLEC